MTWTGGALTARMLDEGGYSMSREWGPFLIGPLAQGAVTIDNRGSGRMLALVTDVNARDSDGPELSTPTQLMLLPLTGSGTAHQKPVGGVVAGDLWNVQYDPSGDRLISVIADDAMFCTPFPSHTSVATSFEWY